MYKTLVHINEESLDQEWVELILAARELGLTQEEIREFLRSGIEQEAI